MSSVDQHDCALHLCVEVADTNDMDVDDLIAAYEGGATMKQIAEAEGITPLALYRRFRAVGYTQRRYGKNARPFTRDDIAEMVSEYEGGSPCSLIAERRGCSDVTVARYLKLAGVRMRVRMKKRTGGRTVNDSGYVFQWLADDDPMSCMRNSMGYVAEHRLVMARALGRPLLSAPTETVHHVDGNPMNNALENLQLRQGHHGAGVALVCASCGSHDVGFAELEETQNGNGRSVQLHPESPARDSGPERRHVVQSAH